MTALERARESITLSLEGAENPAVLWSAQKDSTLLLFLAREIRPDIGIIWFRHHLTKEQTAFGDSLIQKYGLTVYSWLPASRRLLPNDSGLTLIEEFSLGKQSLPIASDITHGDRCVFDLTGKVPFVDCRFDRILIGVKDSDSHYVFGSRWKFPEDAFFNAPLRSLSDKDVWEAIHGLNVPFDKRIYEEDGPDGLIACTRCLQDEKAFCPKAQKEIDGVRWNPGARLEEFRKQLGVE